MTKTFAIVALAAIFFSVIAGSCTLDERGDWAPPHLLLWNLSYGFDQEGECVGGPSSTGWERPQERTPPPELDCVQDLDVTDQAPPSNQLNDSGASGAPHGGGQLSIHEIYLYL